MEGGVVSVGILFRTLAIDGLIQTMERETTRDNGGCLMVPFHSVRSFRYVS